MSTNITIIPNINRWWLSIN